MQQNNKQEGSKKGIKLLVLLIILVVGIFALYKYTNIVDIVKKYTNGQDGNVKVEIVDMGEVPITPSIVVTSEPKNKEIIFFKNANEKCAACARHEVIAMDAHNNVKTFKVGSDSSIKDADLMHYEYVYGIANNMFIEPTELKEGENKIIATEIKGTLSTVNAYLDAVVTDGSTVTYTFKKLVPSMQTKFNDKETIWVKVKIDDNYYVAGGIIEQIEKVYDLAVDWGSLITIVEGVSNDNIEFIIK